MNNKKFLIAALSLILLFAISCGDRPTGSSPSDGSIPKVTGTRVTLDKDLQLQGNGLEDVTPAGLDAEMLDRLFGQYKTIGVLKEGKTDSDYELYWTSEDKSIMEGNSIAPDTSEVMAYLKITFNNSDPVSATEANVELRLNLEGELGSVYTGKNKTPYTVTAQP